MKINDGWMSGSLLKKIAAVSMLIDHTGYLLLGYGVLSILHSGDPRYGKWYCLYRIMRCIGRIAFPVYAFLLTEGIVYTRSWKKYALRLGIFALLSEIPFDLMCHQKMISFETQNVFFTLLIGLLTVKAAEGTSQWLERQKMQPGDKNLLMAGMDKTLLAWITAAGLGCVIAALLKTDYNYTGILLIVLLYRLRQERLKKCVAGFLWIFAALGRTYYIWGLAVAFLLIYFYNGEPGSRRGKYAFYIFYPAHILLLYLIFCWLKGQAGMFMYWQ